MAEKSTFIKIDRNILQWGWYGNGNVLRVFMHLLLVASSKDRTLSGVELKRGDALVTVEQLQIALKLSRQQIRTALSTLSKTGEITIKKIGKKRVYTVVNYGYYQSYTAEPSTTNNPNSNHKVTTNQPEDNHEVTPYKNEKKEKNNILSLSNARAREDTDTEIKKAFGSMYHNVRLTGEEYRALCGEYGKKAADGGIDLLDGHIQKRGAAFRSECHAADIREWCVTKYKKLMAETAEAERKVKQGQTAKAAKVETAGRLDFDLNDFFEGEKVQIINNAF